MVYFYDNWCPNCSRFSSFVQKFDWFKLLDSKKLRNNDDIRHFETINFKLAVNRMASFHKKWNYGFRTIYLILIRLPLFYPIVPLLIFLNLSGLGSFIYNQLAVTRKIIPLHCDSNCEI